MASTTASDSFRQAIAAIVQALTAVGAPFMIIGGIAVIMRGVARQTNDVDATVWAEGLDIDDLVALLERHGIRGRIGDAAAFARAHQVLVDVERLLTLHLAEVDVVYVRTMVAQFAELLEEPNRLREFDRLLAKAKN